MPIEHLKRRRSYNGLAAVIAVASISAVNFLLIVLLMVKP